MKVDPKVLGNLQTLKKPDNQAKTGQSQADATATSTPTKPPEDDSVELTPASLKLQETAESLAAETPVRTELVSALQEQIASGDYEINSNTIADKLIEFDKQS